jgi:hypothetical protein
MDRGWGSAWGIRDPGWTVEQCLIEFRAMLARRDSEAALLCMKSLDCLECWHEAFESLISGPHAGAVTGESVLWFWMMSGFHIADSLQEDLILVKVLKTLLPPYMGVGLTLYRGEARDRYERRALGMSWTPLIEVARMFAKRRDPRGALLKIEATLGMIICGPQEDSVTLREQEYLVDTALVRHVDEVW